MARLSVGDYLRGPETMRPMELVYGVVREPPAPFYGHQSIVTRLGSLLYQHVERRGLGEVCVSPIDVVLDRDRALVLQPDIIFISAKRRGIIRDRVWGAPDLVVEVLSPGTARRDKTQKLKWYGQYGVKECWLVDPKAGRVTVVHLAGPLRGRRPGFRGKTPVRSQVLPTFAVAAERFFE